MPGAEIQARARQNLSQWELEEGLGSSDPQQSEVSVVAGPEVGRKAGLPADSERGRRVGRSRALRELSQRCALTCSQGLTLVVKCGP